MKAATWEVNPTIKREQLESEYIRNPIQARARFECEPPNMEDAYFRDADQVRKAFMYREDPMNEDGTFKSWFNNSDGHTRFIHVDLALKRDRAALCMSHCAGFKEIKTSMGVEQLPIINVDLVYSWEATVGAEINFASIRQMIVDLHRKFDVGLVTFDRWQSIEMIQSLRSMGINSDFHSVKKTDYDTLMSCMYDTRLRGYWNELLVEEELLKLKLYGNNKIDHPSTGSKDLADALAGAVYNSLDHIAVNAELEIEVLTPSIDFEMDDDFDDEGKVYMLHKETKEFIDVNTMNKEEVDKWIELL
jgi:hypothetical protein